MSSFDAYGIDSEEINVSASHGHFVDDDGGDETFTGSGYGSGSYSSFPPAGVDYSGGFPAEGNVAVDHASASPEIFGFDDPNPSYSQSPFNPIHVENGNGYGVGENGVGDDVFVSDGPVLPPPTEMEPEEGVFVFGCNLLDLMVLIFFDSYCSFFSFFGYLIDLVF